MTTWKSLRRQADKVTQVQAVETMIRWGQVIRGWLYFWMGMFAVETVLGWSQQKAGQAEVIRAFGQGWAGKIMLLLVAAGLIGYILWNMVRILRAENLGQGLGFAGSILGYGVLLGPVINSLLGGTTNNTAGININGSPWLLAGAGLVTVISGVIQMRIGTVADHPATKQLDRAPTVAKRQIKSLGRLGYISRGTILVLGGLTLLGTGWGAAKIQNLTPGEILATVSLWPGGKILVGILGLGLIAMGIYSFSLAKFMKVEAVK